MTPKILTAVLAALLLLAVGGPVAARHRHHHRDAPVAEVPPPGVRSQVPYSFYPNDIEGGVHGNLAFNNQLRKLSDPLNANGAGF